MINIFVTFKHFTESRFYHDDLNDKFWRDKEFCPTVRNKLLQIVEDFVTATDMDISIDDIQLTGSLANYNYTPFSDLDVHILTDFSKIDGNTDLVKKALDGKRFIWNLRHEIIIRGHEVELYYQDTNEPHIASGLFSLKNNDWIKEPQYNPPEIDERDVDKKADGFISMIERLVKKIDGDLTPEDAKLCHKKAVALKRKIQQMRRAGLHKHGEFSIENLAFKQLRNTGAIGDLIDAISNSYSKIYSEEQIDPLNKKPNLTPTPYGDKQNKTIAVRLPQ